MYLGCPISNKVSHSPAAILCMNHLGKDILATVDTVLMIDVSIKPVFTFQISLYEVFLVLTHLPFH
jgi:hypothetical protein